MKKRILSIVLAACMLVSLLPVGMIGASALDADTYNEGNAYFRYYVQSFYQAPWYGPTDAQHHALYNNIWQKAEGHSKYIFPSAVANYTGGGTPTLYGREFVTDPIYIIGDLGGADLSFQKYYGLTQANGVQFQILVPSTGTYTPKINHWAYTTASANFNVWLAPIDAEDPMADDYLVGTVSSMLNPATQNDWYDLPAVDLDAGMYIYTVKGNDGKPVFGCSLELWGDEAPEVLEIGYNDADLIDGAIEVPAGDGPVTVPLTGTSTRYGEDYEFEYEISSGSVDFAPEELDAYIDIDTAELVLEASGIPVNNEFSITVLVNTFDGSDWIEVPVRIVAGSQRMIAISHSGNNTNMQKGLATDITINAVVDGEEMEISDELGDVVEVEIYKDGELYEGMNVSTSNGVISIVPDAAGEFVAKVYATVDGVEADVYEIPLTVYGISYTYNYMKMAGKRTGSGTVGTEFIDYIADYADSWTGARTDINGAVESAGWYTGASQGATPFRWTSSAAAYGAYYQEFAPGNWTSVNFYLPIGGEYTVSSIHFAWATSAKLDIYVAPKGAADPIAEANFVGTVDVSAGESLKEVTADAGSIDLAAGEYTVYYVGNEANPATAAYFLKGLKLSLNGDATDSKAYIDMDTAPKFVNVDGAVALPAAKIMPDSLASAITWTTSDASVATIKNGYVYGAGKDGIATITATAADGGSASFEVVVGSLAYSYKISEAYTKAYNAKGYVYTNGYGDGNNMTQFDGIDTYDAVYADATLKSDPWVVVESNIDGTTPFSGMIANWACSVDQQGMLFSLGTSDDAYTRIKIRVSEDGVYRMATKYDQNSAIWAGTNTYIAPIDAEDPMADEYLVGGTAGTYAGGAQSQILFDAVELTAGDYYITVTKLPRVQRYPYSEGAATNAADYISLYSYRLYKLANLSDVAVATVNGAQVRTYGKQGLRFISSIDKNTVDFDKVVEYGTVMIPTADLNTNRDLVIGAEYNGHTAAKVPAVNIYDETDDAVTFTAVLTDIAVANYTRSITARAYAIMEDGSVVYGDTFTARSIFEVAQNGIAAGAEGAELEALQAIVDAVLG